MRTEIIVSVMLLATAFVGCLGDEGETSEDDARDLDQASLERSAIDVPEDAKLQAIEDGYRIIWQDPQLPLNHTLPIPAGATMIEASVQLEADQTATLNLTNARTDLPRCVPAQRTSLADAATGTIHCAALTLPDPSGTQWQLEADANVSTARQVTLDFLDVPIDGLAGSIDLTELSPPDARELVNETTTLQTEDGTSLHAQVMRPATDNPVPVVLINRAAGNATAEATAELAQPLDLEALGHELATRGYAVVLADVRGTGQSGGCLDAWGPTERSDTVQLVQWAAEQGWSNGDVASLGLGYSATTALGVATEAPDALVATVAMAPVADAYNDWHFGGVPNGEGIADPGTTQLLGALGYGAPADRLERVAGSGQGGCDAGQYTSVLDPRAVYDSFYAARNLTDKAEQLRAPVFYTQGLFDRASKPAMADGLVGQLPDESLAFVGPWSHQLPARADALTLVLAFLDQNVKDRDLGLDIEATASVTTPEGLERQLPTWPPQTPQIQTLYPAFDAGELAGEPTDGSAEIVLDPIGASAQAEQTSEQTLIRLEGELDESVHLSGSPAVSLAAELQGLDNAYVAAYLHVVNESGEPTMVSFGMANLAHRLGHGSYEPVQPGETVQMAIQMQPVERTLEAETALVLEIRSAASTDWTLVQPGKTGMMQILGGAEGTLLQLPTTPADQLSPAPTSMQP